MGEKRRDVVAPSLCRGCGMRICICCGTKIPDARRVTAKFCGEKCRRHAEHLRGWTDGWIKQYKTNNLEKIKAYNKQWHKKNPDKDAAQRLKHRDKRLASLRAWKKKNPERVRELRRISAKRHPRLAYRIKWLAENVERSREHKRKWSREHPAEVRANTMRRLAVKLAAMPKWLTREQRGRITDLYCRCLVVTKETNIPHEVDHIIPLRGKNVCGLHVPWNLQLLSSSENRRKSNKFSVENVEEAPHRPPGHQVAQSGQDCAA